MDMLYIVITGIFLGTCTAVLIIAYNKMVVGKFVRALIKHEANHPSFARSFKQLGLNESFFFRLSMRKGGMLRKFLHEPDDTEKKGYYYIPEDMLYRAGRIYGGKDVDGLMVAAVLIVLLFFFGLVIFYLPPLLERFNGLFK